GGSSGSVPQIVGHSVMAYRTTSGTPIRATTARTRSGGAGAVATTPILRWGNESRHTPSTSRSLAHWVGTAPATVICSSRRTENIPFADHGVGGTTRVVPHTNWSHNLNMYPACANGVEVKRRSYGALITPADAAPAARLAPSNTAPFGAPVVPLVKITVTRSDASRSTTGNASTDTALCARLSRRITGTDPQSISPSPGSATINEGSAHP